MGSGSGVKIVSECFVEPHQGLQKPTPPFHLTPWDVNLINFHFHIQNGLLFAVKPPEMKTLLENLKSSLSLTLLHFYPVAGRIRAIKHINGNNNEILILNHENEKEAANNADAEVSYSYHVDCNNSSGVKFIHAISLHKDFGVSDLLHSQSPSYDDDIPAGVLQSLFMDDKDVNDLKSKSLLTITVVELVDGIFLGCSMNHIVADGNSFCYFLSMWSHIFQQQQQQQNIITISRPPMLERWFPDGYGPVLKVPFALRSFDSFTIPQPPPRRARIFHLYSQAIANIKAKAIADLTATNNPNANGVIPKISSFQALSAFLWRTITQVRNLPPDRTLLLVSPINNRSRLDPPLPAEYFGNAVGMIAVITTAGELLSNNLGWAAWKINQAVVNYDDTQVGQWLHDWLKSPRCLMPDDQIKLCSVVVNDFSKFSTIDNEFGILGKPLGFYFGNRNLMSDGNVCACSGREHGSIALDICLSPDAMSRLLSHEHFMEAVR
ncbi:hypothetical protein FEM48_Zijuj10G0003400 [Ziziphus jujuba var. spinosa]|nr:uncharacterized acetyltransferase At3g50280-like [Ziziphus jujuba var. spinosa]KAH7510580.1 hypothetical protein FEM48_ZijujUnG0110500 [Ziziphus jujuba var. spinosa]KAH7515215.1 hypothetical protein FEM48_Zijuj10G0003400 [Ziziphus jujuba var. spinosa]